MSMAMCGKKVKFKGLRFAVCGILIKHKLKFFTRIKKQHYIVPVMLKWAVMTVHYTALRRH